jgi:hypothetical protein
METDPLEDCLKIRRFWSDFDRERTSAPSDVNSFRLVVNPRQNGGIVAAWLT